jgi:hypothetical protein
MSILRRKVPNHYIPIHRDNINKRAPRTMPVSTRDWLSVQMMAVFERDFPPGWLPFVHSTPLS